MVREMVGGRVKIVFSYDSHYEGRSLLHIVTLTVADM